MFCNQTPNFIFKLFFDFDDFKLLIYSFDKNRIIYDYFFARAHHTLPTAASKKNHELKLSLVS